MVIEPASATLVDLVPIANRAVAAPEGALLHVEETYRANRVRLSFVVPDPDVQPARELQGQPPVRFRANQMLLRILRTTQRDMDLTDHTGPASKTLRDYTNGYARSVAPVTAAAFSRMVRETGEAVYRQRMHAGRQEAKPHPLQLQGVAPRVPGTPTECLMQWIAALREAQIDAGPQQARFFARIEAGARRRWMCHDLRWESARAYFQSMAGVCAGTALDGVPMELADALPEPRQLLACEPDQAPKLLARLNDNLPGRVFDTRWLAALKAAPPAGTLRCMKTLADVMANHLNFLPEQTNDVLLAKLADAMNKDRRCWYGQAPLLNNFIEAGFTQARKEAALSLLLGEKNTGADCMATTLFAVKMSLVAKSMHTSLAPWMRASDLNYQRSVFPAKGRESTGDTDTMVRQDGITLRHQIPAAAHLTMRRGVRATLEYRPDLEHPTAAVCQALQHGLPYATGVSGGANLMLHLAHHFRANGIDLDIRHVLLATAMTHSTGHSVHEVLWVANQLDRRLGLNLNLGAVAPDQFVSNYDRFVALFDDEDRAHIEQSVAQAWDDTIDYFRRLAPGGAAIT